MEKQLLVWFFQMHYILPSLYTPIQEHCSGTNMFNTSAPYNLGTTVLKPLTNDI